MSDCDEILKNAIVAILNPDGTVNGTGFFITPDGYILTCYHNVKSTDRIKVKTHNDIEVNAVLIEEKSNKDELVDFAILKIIDRAKSIPYLPLDRNYSEDEWCSIGYKYSKEYKGHPFSGKIIGKAEKEMPATKEKFHDIVLLSDIEVTGGVSGSPLYDKNTGRVIGVIKESSKTRKNEAYAASIEDIFKKWPELEKKNAQERDIPTFFQKLCDEYSKKEKKILIIGDVMLDHTMRGDTAKYNKVESHESEAYMLRKKERESKTLGGAADIARAFSDVSQVTLIGVIGSDCEGQDLAKLCKEQCIDLRPIIINNVLTTTKIYFYQPLGQRVPRWRVIRFDREDTELMKTECLEKKNEICSKIEEAVRNPIDCIVIKDHEKGLITQNIVRKISTIAIDKKIDLFVDPKYTWNKFKDVVIKAILPNIKEALFGIQEEEDEIRTKTSNSMLDPYDYIKLVENYPDCKNFIIKADEKGAVIVSKNVKDEIKIEDIKPLEVGSNLETGIGCGDVFDAYIIIGVLHGYSLEISALFANFVAGLRAEKPLGVIISPKDIKKELIPESPRFKYFKDNKKLVKNIEEYLIPRVFQLESATLTVP